MIFSILTCVACLFAIIWLVRLDRVSLGLPVAYMYSLLLIHVPGAYAHLVAGDLLPESKYTDIGIYFTAVASVCFVAGVACARLQFPQPMRRFEIPPSGGLLHDFSIFCLVGGWLFTYGLSPLKSIPSLGAAVDKAGAVWMLGVMLGLRSAVVRSDVRSAGMWLAALAIYPSLMLLLGGFLSFGSAAIIIVCCVLAIATRRDWRVYAGIVVSAIFSFHVFLSYFQHRDELRSAVWGDQAMEQRMDASLAMVKDFGWFDPTNESQLRSIDLRLNQNYFVGLAASRIDDGYVDYLYGRSLWEGVIAAVPRALWPEKPVVAGSPKIVSEMTGLSLAEGTSFGVGNVMEFQINFGLAGVIAGFLVLGWLLGLLDRKAAAAERDADFARVALYFLPGVALVAPGGSMVELVSGSIAAYVAALGWRWAWQKRLSSRTGYMPGRIRRR